MTNYLKLLDMSEEEQVEFLYIKGYRQLVDTFPAGGLQIKYSKDNEIISVKHSQTKLRFDRRALADLAFKLRDEIGVNMDSGLLALHKKLSPGIPSVIFDEWWIFESKPIHWIIAALIAKDKTNA